MDQIKDLNIELPTHRSPPKNTSLRSDSLTSLRIISHIPNVSNTLTKFIVDYKTTFDVFFAGS